MKTLLFLPLICFPLFAHAESAGQKAFIAVRHCVMENDIDYCHSILTPESMPMFDRFVSYKLMPCLPTDFTYISEEKTGDRTIVRATMPASNSQIYIIRLVFIDMGWDLKLDLPSTFERGLGPKWKDQTDLAEQLYLMMRQHMGDKLNCDMLTGLLKPHSN